MAIRASSLHVINVFSSPIVTHSSNVCVLNYIMCKEQFLGPKERIVNKIDNVCILVVMTGWGREIESSYEI